MGITGCVLLDSPGFHCVTIQPNTNAVQVVKAFKTRSKYVEANEPKTQIYYAVQPYKTEELVIVEKSVPYISIRVVERFSDCLCLDTPIPRTSRRMPRPRSSRPFRRPLDPVLRSLRRCRGVGLLLGSRVDRSFELLRLGW
jgi:hypothetical protein